MVLQSLNHVALHELVWGELSPQQPRHICFATAWELSHEVHDRESQEYRLSRLFNLWRGGQEGLNQPVILSPNLKPSIYK